MSTRPRRIVFLGTHGQYNIGDELLLETFLAKLGPQHHYVVNTYDPDFTKTQLGGRYDVELIDTREDRRELLRHLWRSDLLCFGGGSIVKELYASTGRNRYATLLMILATVTFANLVARKPITMLNIGVGPIATRPGRLLARLILSQVDQLTVRDERSYATCLEIGLGAEDVVLATDAVFSTDGPWLLGDARPSDVVRAPGHEGATAGHGRPVRLALNLNWDIENPDNWELFQSRLAEALTSLAERFPLELHALPMQTGFKEHDDASVLRAFADRVPGIPVHHHAPRTHEDVARIVDGCDLLVSERLHAIVIASLLGVPSFVLAYDVKVRELARMLDLETFSVDINRPFDAAEVTERLADLVRCRATVRDRVLARAAALHETAAAGFRAARTWIEQV